MNHNASTVDYNISRFFIQTPTNENSASGFAACQRWWVCADGYRVGFVYMFRRAIRKRGAVLRWHAREHISGSFCDARRRRRPRKSGADRVAPSAAAAPAQAVVQLWTPGALLPNTSKTRTFAQSQRYGARGRCTRPGVCMWLVWRWQRF